MEELKVDPNKLLTIAEYAKRMGVHRKTVHGWLKDKDRMPQLKTRIISGKRFIEI